jgi:hypothetical protein
MASCSSVASPPPARCRIRRDKSVARWRSTRFGLIVKDGDGANDRAPSRRTPGNALTSDQRGLAAADRAEADEHLGALAAARPRSTAICSRGSRSPRSSRCRSAR